jgi:hypothetical protein
MDLEIYWPVETGHLPCALDEIIDRSSIPHLTDVHAGYLSHAHQVLKHEDMNFVIQVSEGDIRIESYAEFHKDFRATRGLTVLRGIRMLPALEKQADEYWRRMKGSSSWLGVHFRGTDHKKCLSVSPLRTFVPYVEKEPVLFVASDEQNIKGWFQEKYGAVCLDIPLGRRAKEQQLAGIVEWLVLHKCSRILQSAGSSYSELVTLRNGGILIRAQENMPQVPAGPIFQGSSLPNT